MEEESRGETTQQTKQQTQGNPNQEAVDKVQEVGDEKAPAFEQMIADRDARISELEAQVASAAKTAETAEQLAVERQINPAGFVTLFQPVERS